MRLLKVRPTGIFLIAVSATGGLDCTAVVALRTLVSLLLSIGLITLLHAQVVTGFNGHVIDTFNS